MNGDAMRKFREAVLAAAFQRVPGEHYNQVRWQFLERDGGAPLIYELTLPESGAWEQFRDKTFPLLARYVKSQGIDPESPKELVVVTFYRNAFHFIEGVKFMEAFKNLEGLNNQALHFRILQWLEC